LGSLVTDGTLCDADLTLLAESQRGEPVRLRRVCQRFQTPILAMTLKTTGSLSVAVASVESILYGLLEELLLGHMVAVDWPERAAMACATVPASGNSEAGQGIDGMELIPRVARRRVIREVLPQMPLPELMALLLKYADHRSPADMVGLVADTPEDASQRLLAAHQWLQRAIDEHVARLEASP
jgi:hypothetical protein